MLIRSAKVPLKQNLLARELQEGKNTNDEKKLFRFTNVSKKYSMQNIIET